MLPTIFNLNDYNGVSPSKGNEPMTTQTEQTLVNYTTTEGVAIIELTNPPANTYSHEMMRQLDAAILQARFDESVHVILLRGQGEKFFCAGAEISMLKAVTPGFKYYFCLHANETLTRLEQTPKLVIAAMNGHTVGGGLEIAMACDIRIARRDAGKIGLPEVTLGVLPGTGGTTRLSRLVNKSKAIELMINGSTFSFEEAHELGIVNQVWGGSAEEVWAEVVDVPSRGARAGGGERFPALAAFLRRDARVPRDRRLRERLGGVRPRADHPEADPAPPGRGARAEPGRRDRLHRPPRRDALD